MSWDVRVEGDPNCSHENFERATLTLNPPISQVRCRNCGRMLWQRHEPYKDVWPEESGRPPFSDLLAIEAAARRYMSVESLASSIHSAEKRAARQVLNDLLRHHGDD